MAIISDSTLRSGMESGKWVTDGTPSNARRSAYDLTAAKVFQRATNDSGQSTPIVLAAGRPVVLSPGEIAIIQSKEEIHIPTNCCAWKISTNTLAHQGLLLLNPGIMPAGYSGCVAGTFVNFGSQSVSITSTDTFLRIAFQKMDVAATSESQYSSRETLDNWMAGTALRLPRSFLDLNNSIPRYKEEIKEALAAAKEAEIKAFSSDVNRYLLKAFPLVLLAMALLGVIQVGVNYGVHWWEVGSAQTATVVGEKLAKEVVQRTTEQLISQQQLSSIRSSEIERLTAEISELRREINELKSATHSAPK